MSPVRYGPCEFSLAGIWRSLAVDIAASDFTAVQAAGWERNTGPA